jgi:flagellar protein FlaJ
MALQPYLPLFAAAVVVGLLALVPVSRTLDRVLSRVAFQVFGPYVARVGRHRGERELRLRSAHVPSTYRAYATKTLLYSSLMAVVGGTLGMYLIWGVLWLLSIDPETIRRAVPPALQFLAAFTGLETLTPGELFAFVVTSALTVGTVVGFGTYWLRWWWPKHLAATRERQIEASMPQTIAFVYALSRSGMEFPKVMRLLSDHRHVYGHAADEVAVAVRQMDLFGRDMITAISTMGHRSPSEQFQEFTENLSSVLQSGQRLGDFLHTQYEAFQEEAEAQQAELLNLLATLAEVYVTVFVAGPLFLVTILLIIAIAAADTLTLLQVFVYFLLPVGNIGFIVYLSTIMERFGKTHRTEPDSDDGPETTLGIRQEPAADTDSTAGGGAVAQTDGGIAAEETVSARAERQAGNLDRLRIYRQLRWLLDRLGSPVRTVLDRPITLLYVTVPIAVFGTLFRMADARRLSGPVFDDLIVQGFLFIVGTFAIVYEIHKRRIRAIEHAVPDLLDRLASVNEAGMNIIESLDRVRKSDLGALNTELDYIWADIQWGADVETALKRFEARVHTQTISRVVALLTNAMNASGDVSEVMRIAASQSKSDRRLRRQRRQEMLTYVVVVYICFLVFLVIVAALSTVLLPALPDGPLIEESATTGAVPGPTSAIQGLGDLDEGAFRLVLFHTTLIQGFLSGFIAGQMSGGDVRDGAKHASILVLLSYAFFVVLEAFFV